MENEIGIIAGSLRKDSFSKKIAKSIITMQPDGFTFKVVALDDLPIYNQDFDDHDSVPDSYIEFRKKIKEVDGIIFITPEHNRSIPAVLKNAIDVGSRPAGKSVWNDKPAAIFSNSPGNIGAFGANHHLRQCLVFLNMPTMQQPEVYISNASKLFNDQGDFNDSAEKDFIQNAVTSYVKWFNRLKND